MPVASQSVATLYCSPSHFAILALLAWFSSERVDATNTALQRMTLNDPLSLLDLAQTTMARPLLQLPTYMLGMW